jgi:hypothetical protein
MSRPNRDVIVAIGLLLFCGLFFWASFDIREMGYATIGAAVWPRLVLLVLFVLSSLYLFQSLRRPALQGENGGGLRGGGLARYHNALWCYALFLLFLLTLPWLGMLIGGTLFVFLALTVMGERTARAHLIHVAIAVGTIGVMWAIFTYWLRVILPEGEILRIW